jgi:serine phosphatase RsbU (regulator of sigma subunit)
MKITRHIIGLNLTILLAFSCHKKNGGQLTHNLTIKWSAKIDSLLHDTTKITLLIDSLKKQVLHAVNDTAAIDWLSILAEQYPKFALIFSRDALMQSQRLHYTYGIADAFIMKGFFWEKKEQYDSAKYYFDTAEELAKKATSKRLLAKAYSYQGYLYFLKNDYPKAIDYLNQSLQIAKQTGDIARQAECCYSLGDVYRWLPDEVKALDYYSQSLNESKVLGDKMTISNCLMNMGIIYSSQYDDVQAVNYFYEALNISKEVGNEHSLAHCISGIAEIYVRQLDYPAALYYYDMAIQVAKSSGQEMQLAYCLTNIGDIYYDQGNFDKALDYYFQSMNVAKELGSKIRLSESLSSIGGVYLEKKDVQKAKQYAEESLSLSEESNSPLEIQNSANLSYQVFKLLGDYKTALKMHELYTIMKDSITNIDKVRKFDAEASKTKEEQIKVEQGKKDAILIEEGKHQRIVILLVTAGLIIVLFFAGSLFRSLKQNKLKTLIISEQKELVEEKNKDITASINYAKRIQEAILPAKEVKYNIFPDAFILFKPRDIVSGDFYWFAQKDGKRLIAAVDCTGHGVPGAFMSMIGNAFLEEIVNIKGIIEPNLVLDELHKMVLKSLKQTGMAGEARDGMDIALLSFDDANHLVEFAGANNPLWKFSLLNSERKMEEYLPDKRPIGYFIGQDKPFTKSTIQLKAGDTLYIFSDGYADQFGGPKGKKFKYKQLQETLLSIQDKPMLEQETVLLDAFNNWKGKLEQVDDVLVIGIRV